MEDTGPDDLATLNFKLYTLLTNSSSSSISGVSEVENLKQLVFIV